MGMVIDRSHVPSLAVPDTKTMDPKPWLCPVGSWLITIVGALTLVASVILAETLTVAAPAAIFTVVGVTVELTKTGALTSAAAADAGLTGPSKNAIPVSSARGNFHLDVMI